MPGTEQLKLVTPEYTQGLSELDALVASLPNQFPDDIEYSKAGFRLPLCAEGMPTNVYYTVAKYLTYPYPETPDWDAVPAELAQVTDWGDGGGCISRYAMKEGLLTARSYAGEAYDSDFPDAELPAQELSEVEIRKIIEELSIAQPLRPTKAEQERVRRTTKNGSLIRRVLFRR